jgi:hypothetical protein
MKSVALAKNAVSREFKAIAFMVRQIHSQNEAVAFIVSMPEGIC